MTVFIVILVVALVISIAMIINVLFSKRIPKDTVIALTGGLGTGKTLIGVKVAVQSYKKHLILWILGFMKEEVNGKKQRVRMPHLYSNIPIMVKMPLILRLFTKTNKMEMSKQLRYEHITLQDRIPEYSIIFMDELGQIADQYSYNNPFVMQYIQRFIRFYRHFIDGRIIVTDQSSSNIVVAVRRRLNTIYNLHDFRRVWFFQYKVTVDTVLISEDMLSVKDTAEEDIEYFAGHLPFKWLKRIDITRLFSYKKYDSRCYSPLYDHVQHILPPTNWNAYKTDYIIDIPNNQEMKKQFQRDGFISQEDMMKYVNAWQQSLKEDKEEKEKEDLS